MVQRSYGLLLLIFIFQKKKKKTTKKALPAIKRQFLVLKVSNNLLFLSHMTFDFPGVIQWQIPSVFSTSFILHL